jgi:hypothetical protein
MALGLLTACGRDAGSLGRDDGPGSEASDAGSSGTGSSGGSTSSSTTQAGTDDDDGTSSGAACSGAGGSKLEIACAWVKSPTTLRIGFNLELGDVSEVDPAKFRLAYELVSEDPGGEWVYDLGVKMGIDEHVRVIGLTVDPDNAHALLLQLSHPITDACERAAADDALTYYSADLYPSYTSMGIPDLTDVNGMRSLGDLGAQWAENPDAWDDTELDVSLYPALPIICN